MRRSVALAVAVLFSVGGPAAVWSQEPLELPEEDTEATEASRNQANDPRFGPLVVIERIEVEGNSSTGADLITRVLRFKVGDALHTGDPRLLEARYKVLALGYFRDARTRLGKGSSRGRVVFTITVEERGTITLERFHIGTSSATPWWAGLDMSERNLLGTGVSVGGAFVVAGEGDASGADGQSAFELRVGKSTLRGTRLGMSMSALFVDASEPYRVAGDESDDDIDEFSAFPYRRFGLRGGLSWDLNPIMAIQVAARFEHIDASVPLAATRVREDGTSEAIEFHLQDGKSRLLTGSLGYERDTRSDPVLTERGTLLRLYGELGASFVGGEYDYATVLAQYQQWWSPKRRHVLSMHLTGGVVIGEAPLFERLYVGDLNRLVVPRALGLVVSTTPSKDLLGTGMEGVRYGDVGGVAEFQYSYQLFRRRKLIYGGDIYFGVGVWALADIDDLSVRDENLYRALPFDLLVDVGLRLDTEIGIFELSLANGFGRVPL